VATLQLVAAEAVQLAETQLAPPVSLDNGHSSAAVPSRSGGAAAEELVHAALSAVLQAAVEGLADESTSEEDAATVHIDAVQGVVRALDAAGSAANGSVAAADVSPAGAPSTDAEDAQQAVTRYRQEVWDALQGFATAHASSRASSPAAVAARVHVLDLLSAIARHPGTGGPPRWGDWRPPAAAAGSGPDAQHSLVYSCTRALLDPLWPDQTGAMTPADLADVSAARSLFTRLLDAAESPQQLAALAELLEDTWQNGAELASVEAGTDQTGQGSSVCDEAGNAEAVAAVSAVSDQPVSDVAGASGRRGCWVPAIAEGDDEADEPDLCALHDCWAALLIAMLRHGQTAAVVKLVDGHAASPHWLTPGEAHSLATAAYSSAGALPSAFRCPSKRCEAWHSIPTKGKCLANMLHAASITGPCLICVTWLLQNPSGSGWLSVSECASGQGSKHLRWMRRRVG